MGRTTMWLCGVCIIFASISLNVFLVTYHYASVEKLKQQKLSWSEAAAAEAEAVASIYCSGHGFAYVDGLRENDKPVCECNNCYAGPDCSLFLTNCSADANSGDPKFLETFWKNNAAKSAVVISGWHRMSYGFADGSYISEQLTDHIRQLHAKAKNAVAHDKYIVFGVGSLQLLSAAVFALSINRTSPATVLADPPYYPLFRTQTNYFETARFKFNVSILSSYDGEDAIEFVTIPTNPEGTLKGAALNGTNVKHIHDYACYWPHYTAIPAPADDDLMLFSLSKFTGHAGTRLGWALVRDKSIYDNMVQYISLAESGTSREAQLRSLQLLKTIIHSNANDTSSQIFEFAFKTLRERWLIIIEIFSSSTRFQIQDVPDQYCNYFGRVRGASPAYAWVKCVREEESSCWEIMNAAKIVGRAGRDFDADDSYVRLSLIKREDDFNQVVSRLRDLIAKENGAVPLTSSI